MSKIKKIALLAVGDSAWQGGIQYITNIIHALDASSKGLEIHLFKRNTQVFIGLENFKSNNLIVHSIEKTIPPFTFSNRVVWLLQRIFLGRINPQYENYLIHHKFDYVFPAMLSNCWGKLNSGAWIADFQYHHFPDGHNKEINLQAEKAIGFIANKAQKIVFSSEFCKQDSYRLFPQTLGKSHVMPFAVYIDKAHLADHYLCEAKIKYDIAMPYLMVSNLFGATKNHKTLFEALGILRKQGLKIRLVCTGNFVNYAQMEFTNEILQMITENGIRDQLYILGLIPREHQIALYRMAMCVVQPSVNEGWSTCVEEAKALGKVLLLSGIDVHKEQNPDNPFFFMPTDPEDLSKKIETVHQLFKDTAFPELEKENLALQEYDKIVQEFGENFLAIASK